MLRENVCGCSCSSGLSPSPCTSLSSRWLVMLPVGLRVVARRLPIEAYHVVANMQIDGMTIGPGRATEEAERFGRADIHAILADSTESDWARQQVRELIAQAEVPADPIIAHSHTELGSPRRAPRACPIDAASIHLVRSHPQREFSSGSWPAGSDTAEI